MDTPLITSQQEAASQEAAKALTENPTTPSVSSRRPKVLSTHESTTPPLKTWSFSARGSKADVGAAIDAAKVPKAKGKGSQAVAMHDHWKAALKSEIAAHSAQAVVVDAHWHFDPNSKVAGRTVLHLSIAPLF
jgi:hypothetical protein